MNDAVIEMWRANERINQHFLQHLPENGLSALPLLKSGRPSRGRNIARSWVHMHEVRAAHLRKAEEKMLTGAPEFSKEDDPSKKQIMLAFALSAKAVEARYLAAVEHDEQIRSRPPGLFIAYLSAHEAHHRGQMMLALKQSGIKYTDELKWGIWSGWFKV